LMTGPLVIEPLVMEPLIAPLVIYALIEPLIEPLSTYTWCEREECSLRSCAEQARRLPASERHALAEPLM
jgi:hypothetical protein